jgi:hypothetical protein
LSHSSTSQETEYRDSISRFVRDIFLHLNFARHRGAQRKGFPELARKLTTPRLLDASLTASVRSCRPPPEKPSKPTCAPILKQYQPTSQLKDRFILVGHHCFLVAARLHLRPQGLGKFSSESRLSALNFSQRGEEIETRLLKPQTTSSSSH